MLSPLRALALTAALTAAACAPQDALQTASAAPDQPPVIRSVGLDSAMRLSEAAMAGGDFGAAVRILEAASNAHPKEPAPRAALGEAYLRAGALPEAGQTFRELKQFERAMATAEAGLGRVALANGEPGEAESHFAAALALIPNDRRTLNGRAVALDHLGRHREAQTIYARLLNENGADREALNNRALSLALSGDLIRARRELEMLAAAPGELRARHNLALVAALEGDFAEAEAILSEDLSDAQVARNLAFYKQMATRR